MVERKGVDQRSETKPPGALGDGGQENAGGRRHAQGRRVVLRQMVGVEALPLVRLDQRQTRLVVVPQRQIAAV